MYSPLHLADDILRVEPLGAAVQANVIEVVVVTLGQEELGRVPSIVRNKFKQAQRVPSMYVYMVKGMATLTWYEKRGRGGR